MPALTSTANPGWLSPADAVALIEKHTKSDPTVDLKRMMKGYRFIRRGFTFNIFLRKRENGVAINCGVLPCMVETELDAISLKQALKDSFKKAAGFDFDEAPVQQFDTVAQPDATLSASSPAGKRRKGKPQTERGATMISGDITTGTNVRSDSTTLTDGLGA